MIRNCLLVCCSTSSPLNSSNSVSHLTEQSRLDVAQGSGSGVVSWFDASSINGHGLLEEDPVTPKRQVRNEIVLAGPEWCFLRYKHGAALFALGNLDFSSGLLYPPVSCSLSSCRLRCTRKLDCFPWLDSGYLSVSSQFDGKVAAFAQFVEGLTKSWRTLP